MASLLLRKRFFSPGDVVGFLIGVPVAAIILLALYLAVASVYENMRFGHAMDQVLSLIAASRDYATRDAKNTVQPGENLVATLARTGFVAIIATHNSAITLKNPWGGDIRMVPVTESSVRLETELPTHDCRRFALLLRQNAGSLGLEMMEAREDAGAWRRFFEGSPATFANPRPIEAACGQAQAATLAVVYRLR